ncbi:MAG: hypothetical protein IJO76_00735 [Clostridia bacterium]|nr:hypothetical protein [Clostridia bacterium]
MKIYAHSVDPKKYPAFDKRPNRVVTREALGDEIQFTSARYFPHTLDYKQLLDIDKTIKQYTEDYDIGKGFWLNWTTKYADNFPELVEKIAAAGAYLYGFWGIAPGIREDQNLRDYGYFSIPKEWHGLMQEVLGDHFLGYDIGETDGWYIGGYVSREDNAAGPKTRLGQYKAFEEYFEEIADNFYNKCTILCALTTVHYFARQGYAMMLNCESAQSLPNPQMWYGFLRGASKQYGILCGGNVSVWNRWGYKTYESSGGTAPTARGPEEGTSLSLMKRLMYTEYMYGCEMFGFEQTWFTDDNEEMYRKKLPSSTENVPIFGKLSPLGHINQYANRLIKKIGRPGVMYTPVAVVADAFTGWLPPRHLYTRKLYQAWGNIPYAAGDWQMNALFNMLYPGYADAGFYQDERGFLSATPYGEITDVLLSDVSGAVLGRYDTALVVNGTHLTYELYDKLRTFVENGGHTVVFADTVAQYEAALKQYDKDYTAFFGISRLGDWVEMGGAAVTYGGQVYPADGLRVLSAQLTADAQVVAAAGEQPVIITTPHGEGSVTVILAQDGLQEKDTLTDLTNTVEMSVGIPYDFAAFIKAYLGDLFTPYTLVKTSNEALQYVVTVKDEKTLRVLVNNNTSTAQAYDLLGDIAAVKEISLADGSPEMVGYYPMNHTVDNDTVLGKGSHTIPALDVQLFEVTLKKPLTLADEVNPAAPARKCGVKMPADVRSVKDFLLENPTFDQYFDTVLVDGEYFERASEEQVQRDARYLRLKNVKVSVDLTSLCNHFPDFNFETVFPEWQEKSYKRLDTILDRLFLCPADTVFVTLTRNGTSTVDALKEDLKAVWTHVQRRCKAYGVRTAFINRPVLLSTDKMLELAAQVPELDWALNVGGALCGGADLQELAQRAPAAVVLNAPVKDVMGQLYNSAATLYDSPYGEDNRHVVQTTDGDVYLGGTYANWNEIYADYKLIFGEE